MTYADFGPKLVERGYSAIPILPGTKQPGELVRGEPRLMYDWTRFKDRAPTEYELDHWATTVGDYGIGLVMSRGLIGVDIDVDDADVLQAIRLVVGPTMAVKAGCKGETRFYVAPGVGLRSYNEYIPDATQPTGYRRGRRLCDIIGPGRQTVLPPSIHPDTGQPYRWIGYAALDALDLDELPVLTPDVLDRIGDALKPFGYMPDAAIVARSETPLSEADNPFRALNNAALCDLSAWVSKIPFYKLKRRNGGYVAVAHWRASSTGRPLEKRSANLKIHPLGIVDFHDGEKRYTPINLVMAATGCDEGEAFVKLSEWLGRDPNMVVDLPMRQASNVNGDLIDSETGEVLVAAKSDAAAIVSPPIGHARGLVADISDWITSIARRPQERLSFAAALSIVGTVASRQMVTPTYSNLNLYMLLTARTGNGKDAPMKAVKSVLSAANLPDMIGPEGAASDVGLLDFAARYPVSVLPIDEFGDFIAATTGTRASPHTLKIMSVMRSLWDGGLIKTTHAISRNSETLHNPCISMICASTPAQFFDAVGSAQMLNGFLNRFLLTHVGDRARRGRDDANIDAVPTSIVESICKLADRPGGFDMSRFRIGPCNQPLRDRASVVPWSHQGVRQEWIRYEEENIGRMEADKTLEALAPRCPQNAIKIATILAIGEDIDRPCVTFDHLTIAISFVERSLADMRQGYTDHLRASATADIGDKIIEKIVAAGGFIYHRDLYRAMARAFAKSRDLDDMMRHLANAGRIEANKEIVPGGERILYRLVA